MINIINNCKLDKNDLNDSFYLFDNSLDYSYEESISILDGDCFMFYPLLAKSYIHLSSKGDLIKNVHVSTREDILANFNTPTPYPYDVFFEYTNGTFGYESAGSMEVVDLQGIFSCQDEDLFNAIFEIAYEVHKTIPFVDFHDVSGDCFDIDWVKTRNGIGCFRVDSLALGGWAKVCFKTEDSLGAIDYPLNVFETSIEDGFVSLFTNCGDISFSYEEIDFKNVS